MKIDKISLASVSLISFILQFFIFTGYASAKDVKLVKFERKISFEFKVDIGIFRFEGKNLTPQQRTINRKIEDLVNANLQAFCYDFSEFLKNDTDSMPSLEMVSTPSYNSGNYFSMRVDIIPWHQGACGFPGEVETFNFKIVDDKVKALAFSDVVPSQEERKLILREAVNKILTDLARDYPNNDYLNNFDIDCSIDNFDYELLKFTFSSNFIEIIFPAGTMFPGTIGMPSTKVKFNSLESLSQNP